MSRINLFACLPAGRDNSGVNSGRRKYMLWETIKSILQKQGGTCIIVEDGRPVYVITNFDEYENLLSKETVRAEKAAPSASEQPLLEKINHEIENWKTAQAEAQAQEAAESADEEVKIEDLPV